MAPTLAAVRAAAAALLCGVARANAGSSGRGGFCCWASEDLLDFCGSCLPAAVAGPSSYCSKSQAACHSCGAATWCEDKAKRNKQVSGGTELLLTYDASKAPRHGSALSIDIGGRAYNATVVESDFQGVSAAASTTADAAPQDQGSGPSSGSSGGVRPSGLDAVAQHGRLQVKGSKLVGEHGKPVRLRGVSLFWSQWMGKYWTADVVRWLKKDWHVSLIRAAMAVESGGYIDNPGAERQKLEAVVDACIEEGVYVIIDWHDYHAENHLEDAKAFFGEMAKKYGDEPAVLFETFNEPQQEGWKSQIEPYHEQVVKEIRKHSDNVIILGTRTWSQEVDKASKHPVPGENLAYTVHFYAASMGQELRDRVVAALRNGVAVFATEWGTCEYTGDGRVDLGSTQEWLDFLEEHQISDANWAISDKPEACSALRDSASASGGWSEEDLTESGAFVRGSIRERAHAAPGGGDVTEAFVRKHSLHRGLLRAGGASGGAAVALAGALLACAAAVFVAGAAAARRLRAGTRQRQPPQPQQQRRPLSDAGGPPEGSPGSPGDTARLAEA